VKYRPNTNTNNISNIRGKKVTLMGGHIREGEGKRRKLRR
jgi:hypothetical protein